MDYELPEVLFHTLVTVCSRETTKEAAIAEDLITLLHSALSKMGTKGIISI